MEIRGVSFNLRLDTPVDQENRYLNRKEALFDYLKQQSVDLYCFQEVLPFMQVDLQEGLPDYTVIGNPRYEGQESTPIAYKTSRFHLKEHQTIWLTDTPTVVSKLPHSAHHRVATLLLLEDRATRTPFVIVNTHLDYKSESVITMQMSYLLHYLKSKEWQLFPLLLAGDFNQLPHQEVHRLLQSQHLRHVYEQICEMKKTFHGYSNDIEGEPIDYWYYNSFFKLTEAWIDTYQPKNGFLSDHYPVFATFQL